MTTLEKPAIYNGTYTIRNRNTGEHRTFRIKTQKPDARFAPGERIIGLLVGANNETDYESFGFVRDDKVLVWGKKRAKDSTAGRSAWEWYAVMLQGLCAGNSEWCDKYEMMVERRCLRCGRKLTTPQSIEMGIGPECASKF